MSLDIDAIMREYEGRSLVPKWMPELVTEVVRLRARIATLDRDLNRAQEACEAYVRRIVKLRARVATLQGVLGRVAARRCLCGTPHVNHGGPCCGVDGGLCVTCEARSLLDVSHDEDGERDG